MIENIAHACVTRPCETGYAEKEAVCWVHPDFSEESFSFGYFETESNRMAKILQRLGVETGTVVSIFLARSPLLVSSFFGILKLQAVSCILFSTLGEEALLDRLGNSRSQVVITKKSLLRKILSIRPQLPCLKTVLVADLDEHQDEFILSLPKLLTDMEPDFVYPVQVENKKPAFLQYTSGSTGKPKGALHVHDALSEIRLSFDEILQLQSDDKYWCTADPAWITGLVYGIIAPFACLARQIQFGGGFKAVNWMWVLEKKQVNIWYTAPTALRMLMQEDKTIFSGLDLNPLKRIYSVGEPLNPDIYFWGKSTFHTEIYDTWFQSETGSIQIANRPGLAVKAGSMGLPRSGIEALICGEQMEELPAGSQGYLCLRKGCNSMFHNYFCNQPAYNEKFRRDIYLTGDLAKRDADGYLWYISRADDVINTAGHLIGPFEVESALLEIEEIADAAVVGVDDPLLHQKIIAFITLKNGRSWSKELELKCRIYVANKVSSTAIPAEFCIVPIIPKNKSGKILRRVLKANYEGKEVGDLSTMETME